MFIFPIKYNHCQPYAKTPQTNHNYHASIYRSNLYSTQKTTTQFPPKTPFISPNIVTCFSPDFEFLQTHKQTAPLFQLHYIYYVRHIAQWTAIVFAPIPLPALSVATQNYPHQSICTKVLMSGDENPKIPDTIACRRVRNKVVLIRLTAFHHPSHPSNDAHQKGLIADWRTKLSLAPIYHTFNSTRQPKFHASHDSMFVAR